MNQHEEVLSYNNLGSIYQRFKLPEKALYYYQEAEKINNAYALIYLNRGNLFSAQGFFNKAISEYRKAIQYDQKFAGAYANLGYVLLMIGNTDKAIEYLEIGQKLGLTNIRMYRLLGHAYRKKKANDRAYLMFKKAQELNPEDPITLLYLIGLYASRGMPVKRNEAVKSFFDSFQGNVQEIERFMEEVFGSENIQAVILPDRNCLLPFLAEECRLRGQAYQNLTDFLSSK